MALVVHRVALTGVFEEREVVAIAENDLVRGKVYRVVVDGETVAEKRNWLKRPGTFRVTGTLEVDGEEHAVELVVRQRLGSTEMTVSVDGAPLPLVETEAARRASKRGRIVVIGIAIVAVALGAMGVTPLIPTSTSMIASRVTPFSASEGRQPARCDTLATREGCDAVQVDGVTDEEVRVPSSNPERGIAELHGTMFLPSGPEPPHPALVLIGGSGPSPRSPALPGGLVLHHDPFELYRAIADVALDLGVAVLLYDKRTCRGCYRDAHIELAEFRFEHFEDDARDALRYLRTRPDIDGDALVTMGHSQGGGTAVRLAAEEVGVVAAVMLAGSTRPFREGLPGQVRRLAEVRMAQFDPIQSLFLDWQAGSYERCFEESRRDPDAVRPCLFNTTYRAFEEEAERASLTRTTIESLSVPVLAIQGQLDINIDPATLVELRGPLRERDAELHVIEGVGHTFVSEDDLDDPRLSDSVVHVLREFLRSVPRHR